MPLCCPERNWAARTLAPGLVHAQRASQRDMRAAAGGHLSRGHLPGGLPGEAGASRAWCSACLANAANFLNSLTAYCTQGQQRVTLVPGLPGSHQDCLPLLQNGAVMESKRLQAAPVYDGTLGRPSGGVSSSNRGRQAVEAALARAAGAWAAGAGAVTMAVRLLCELVCSFIQTHVSRFPQGCLSHLRLAQQDQLQVGKACLARLLRLSQSRGAAQ